MRNFYNKNISGISAIELLIVSAIVVLLVALVIPQFSKIKENQVLKSAVGDTLSAVNKARSKTLASYNSLEYGVHFESDKVIIFQGTVYSQNDVNNENISIYSPASISNVTLNGSSGTSGNFYFSRVYSVPSKTGTITISTNNYSRILTINQAGNINSN